MLHPRYWKAVIILSFQGILTLSSLCFGLQSNWPTNSTSNFGIINGNFPSHSHHIRRRFVGNSKGVGFTRSVEYFPSNPEAFVLVEVEPRTACRQADQYGDNDCHFSWGTHFSITYDLRFGQQITADDYFEGHLMVGTSLIVEKETGLDSLASICSQSYFCS